jgi:hypothetical protein
MLARKVIGLVSVMERVAARRRVKTPQRERRTRDRPTRLDRRKGDTDVIEHVISGLRRSDVTSFGEDRPSRGEERRQPRIKK